MTIETSRGKVLRGSSSINMMAYSQNASAGLWARLRGNAGPRHCHQSEAAGCRRSRATPLPSPHSRPKTLVQKATRS
jgi:hypothetical protein